ncbi:Arm DNA-binding domain-containing protein [Tateyamaria sp.]|uniref:Arm DNA-binding domain-containing protein n=1 Tax=Tateyamaria sp. TaxID=1929288 RepID=UPI0039B985D6
MRTGALNKLTTAGVRSAKDGMHSDGGGLYLRIKGGARAWVFRYTADGKKRDKGLGSAAAVSLASARDKAAQARQAVAETPWSPSPRLWPLPQPARRCRSRRQCAGTSKRIM